MNCEVCGEEIQSDIVILPIHQKNGMYNTLACVPCSEKTDHYCMVHRRPHLNFGDGEPTACKECIEEMVNTEAYKEAEIFQQLNDHLPEVEFRKLLGFSGRIQAMSGERVERVIFRYIAIIAIRSKISVEHVVAITLKARSVSNLIG